MKMNSIKFILLGAIVAMSSTAFAGNKHGHKKARHLQHNETVYAKVINVKPVYRKIRVKEPVQECWSEPVSYSRRTHANHALGNTIAGGIIGGIIGNQIGGGRGKDLATAVGTVIGAQAGHNSARSHHDEPAYDRRHTRYEERCETRHQVKYKKVIDSYRVSYRYKGKRYKTNMPYDPGKKIKLKISFEPVY